MTASTRTVRHAVVALTVLSIMLGLAGPVDAQGLRRTTIETGLDPSQELVLAGLSGAQLEYSRTSRFTHELEGSQAFRYEWDVSDWQLFRGSRGASSAQYRQVSTSLSSTPQSQNTPSLPSSGNILARSWLLITGVEIALIGVCASLPRSFTGWSDDMVGDALRNLGEAYTKPPVWDDDAWAINYVGHPYGGAVYYNTVRCQGATPFQSFLFSTALSLQWEYIVEAVAERPSTQDLLLTSTTGAILGESIHQLTKAMKKNGTNIFEKTLIFILNPTSVVFVGFN